MEKTWVGTIITTVLALWIGSSIYNSFFYPKFLERDKFMATLGYRWNDRDFTYVNIKLLKEFEDRTLKKSLESLKGGK